MANSNEIAQIDQINKGLTDLNATLNTTASSYLKLVKTIEDGNKVIKNSAQTTEELERAKKKTADTSKELDALGKQLAASEAKLKQTEDERLKTIIQNRIATEEATKAIKDKIKSEEAAEGSLVSMRQELSRLTKEYDQSAVRTKEAADQINNLSKKIEEAEKATNRHQRGVGGYKEAIKDTAKEFLGFTGAVGIAIVVVDKLKEAFAETEAGVRFFKRIGEASTTFFQNMLSGNTQLMGVNALISADVGKRLDDLRIEERQEQIKVAGLNTEVKMLRLKAVTTKDLTEQLAIYKEADAKENESIAIRKEHLTKEIELLTELSLVRPEDTKLLDELSQKKVEIITLEGDKNLRIQTKIAADQEKIEKKKEDDAKAATEAEKKRFESKVLAFELVGKKEVETINESHIKGLISDAEYKGQLVEQEMSFLTRKQALYKADSKEYADLELAKQELTIKGIDDKKKAYDDTAKWQKQADEDAFASLEKQLQDQESFAEKTKKEQDQINAEKLKAEEKLAEKKKELKQKEHELELQLARTALDGIFNLNKQKLDAQLSDLEKEKEAKLSNTNLTAAQKANIEKEYAKKEAEVKTKQAHNDRLKAMFDIAINTAVGIVKASPNLVLMALTAAVGAMQEAFVIAQPIPKFAKGTNSAPERGLFGEAGRELMLLRDNSVMLADKPTYFEGGRFKGAKIYSNPETERMIGMADRRISGQSINDERILAGLEKLNTTILSKPVAIYDNDHRAIGLATSRHQEIYLNRLTRNQS